MEVEIEERLLKDSAHPEPEILLKCVKPKPMGGAGSWGGAAGSHEGYAKAETAKQSTVRRRARRVEGGCTKGE